MHRFEYQARFKNSLAIVLVPILFAFVLTFLLYSLSFVSTQSKDKERKTLEEAVQRYVMLYYAEQGCYPSSLMDLKEDYGLTYDDEVFFIDYVAYGENLYPSIVVLDRRSFKE